MVETKNITEYATVRNRDEWASALVAAEFLT